MGSGRAGCQDPSLPSYPISLPWSTHGLGALPVLPVPASSAESTITGGSAMI